MEKAIVPPDPCNSEGQQSVVHASLGGNRLLGQELNQGKEDKFLLVPKLVPQTFPMMMWDLLRDVRPLIAAFCSAEELSRLRVTAVDSRDMLCHILFATLLTTCKHIVPKFRLSAVR